MSAWWFTGWFLRDDDDVMMHAHLDSPSDQERQRSS
jgi:hypothetical protein